MTYTYINLVEAYETLGICEGDTVNVTSDLTRLMAFENADRSAILEAHFQALKEAVGSGGTIDVPSASANLYNSDTSFDLENTPSHKVGVLSEYIRTRPGAKRSFHPFVSYAAIGAKANYITDNVSRNAFGPETPCARMVAIDAKCISIGLYPSRTSEAVHHVEHLMAVPYRYTKEFHQNVVREGEIVVEPFYSYLLYKDCGIKRSFSKWIWKELEKTDMLRSAPIGRASIYSYSLREFVDAVCGLLRDDIYFWCEEPPTIRPWQK